MLGEIRHEPEVDPALDQAEEPDDGSRQGRDVVRDRQRRVLRADEVREVDAVGRDVALGI